MVCSRIPAEAVVWRCRFGEPLECVGTKDGNVVLGALVEPDLIGYAEVKTPFAIE